MSKACRRCAQVLPLDNFYRRKDSADGRQYLCKVCTRSAIAEWESKNPDAVKARWKRNSKTDARMIYLSAWRERNRAKLNSEARSSYHLHREERMARHKAWVAANRDKMREIKRRYNKENPLRVLAWLARRRFRKANAPGDATAEQIMARIQYYGGKCHMCKVAPYEHLDHVIPLARGGSNWPANIRPSCAACNLHKSDRLLSEVS